MTARTDLATAASTVDGVTGHPYIVGNTQPGTAYVRLDRIEYPNKFGGVCTWQVVVILPQDYAAAEKWIETHHTSLTAALGVEMTVTRLSPERLQLDGIGVLPVVIITGRREADPT